LNCGTGGTGGTCETGGTSGTGESASQSQRRLGAGYVGAIVGLVRRVRLVGRVGLVRRVRLVRRVGVYD